MEKGKKYRIIFDVGLQKDREAVLKFLGENHENTPLHEYVFDARPLAGTQTIEKRFVKAIYEVHNDEKLMLPRIYRGETRVL